MGAELVEGGSQGADGGVGGAVMVVEEGAAGIVEPGSPSGSGQGQSGAEGRDQVLGRYIQLPAAAFACEAPGGEKGVQRPRGAGHHLQRHPKLPAQEPEQLPGDLRVIPLQLQMQLTVPVVEEAAGYGDGADVPAAFGDIVSVFATVDDGEHGRYLAFFFDQHNTPGGIWE